MELLFAERTVIIRNRGSVEFTEAEQAADIVLVDVKCTALGGTIYVNNKTLPSYGFYGSVTLFGGATVRQRISLEFPYQRVLDFETDYRRIKCYLTKLEEMLQFIGDTVSAPAGTPPAGGDPPDSFDYRGLPYSKLKINSERLAQYSVVVRSYTEATAFECQAVSRPDDPTNGEDEYPTPLPIPNGGAFPPELPAPTAPYPGADPEDFDFEDTSYLSRVRFGFDTTASSGNGPRNACPNDLQYNLFGIWENAGPPPYTIEAGPLNNFYCFNVAANGFRVVAANGAVSPYYYIGTGFFTVTLITTEFDYQGE